MQPTHPPTSRRAIALAVLGIVLLIALLVGAGYWGWSHVVANLGAA